ncbi:tail fiber domain-containing protein [Escherichia coli]|nr:tail fiber domain-containing protein [Escherichia coli]
MTVSTEVDHNEYTGNGVTTSFPYTFRIFRKSDLVVQVSDLNGNVTELVLDTGYTVTGAGTYSGGSVVLPSPLAAGWRITIDRVLDVVQETDLRNQGKFFPEVHEDAFDYLTMLIQQCFGWFRRALMKPSLLAKYYDAKQNRISNLADPSLEQDAVNNRSMRNYVDAAIAGVVGGFGWFIQYGSGAVYRTFQDKMRDTVSPKDFGAVGDGVTNDSLAFESLEAAISSRIIDMQGKTYFTSRTFFRNTYINGKWLVGGKVIPVNGELVTSKRPAWDVNSIRHESNAAIRFIPIANGRGQIRTLQTFAYDPVSRAYYSNHNTEIDGNPTTVSVWNKYSADSKIKNTSSDFMLPEDRLGHQGIAVQNIDNAIKLWTTAPDTPAGSTTHTDFDFSVGGSHGVVRFSWRSNSEGEIDSPEMFRVVEENRTAGSSTTPTITLDGKWMIIRFTDNGDYNKQTFRVFSTDIFDKPGDYSALCTHEFTLQLSQVGGDETTSLSGFCSDGSHLYMYCGNTTFGQTQYLSSCDLLGNDVQKAISNLGDTDLPRIIGSTPTFRESEGMHFVDYDGVLYPSVTIVSEHSDVMGATRRTILIYALGAGDKRTLSLPSKEICISDNPEVVPHVIYSGDTTWGENSPIKALKFNNEQGTGLLYEWQRKGVGYFQMYMSTSNVALMAANGADLHLGSNDTWRWKVSPNGHWHPYLDNSYSVGVPDNRPTQIYAVSGSINTSDGREKSDPLTTSELSLNMSPGYEGDVILDAWGDIRIVAFRWLEAIREKGDGARWHFGVIAQQVRDAFLAHGVDGTRFGLLCYDEWDDKYEPVMAVRTITEVVDGVEIEKEEEYETEERILVRKAGNRWGIRADQCLWLESAYLRRRIEKIESHLAELNNLLNPEGGSK